MKSKEILTESQRAVIGIIQSSGAESVLIQLFNEVVSALLVAEKEIKDNEQSYLTSLIERDKLIHKHISKIQELEKEIKEYKKLAQHNVPELVKMLKERKG